MTNDCDLQGKYQYDNWLFFLAIPLKTEKEICKIVANKSGWLRSNSYSLSDFLSGSFSLFQEQPNHMLPSEYEIPKPKWASNIFFDVTPDFYIFSY